MSSKRFPSWNSWDLLRCSAVKPGSRWISLRLGGGGVPGAFTLFRRRMGGVPGGVMVLTTRGVRGGVWPKCLWRGDGGRERWPESRAGKSPMAELSTVSRSAYKGGARAWGLWHMCWLYLDWTLGLCESWNRIHWLGSGWHTGVFSLPDSEVGHWMDQSCFTWLPVGEGQPLKVTISQHNYIIINVSARSWWHVMIKKKNCLSLTCPDLRRVLVSSLPQSLRDEGERNLVNGKQLFRDLTLLSFC